MEGSFHLGRIGGVRLRAHVSLLVGLPIFAWLAGRRMEVAVVASVLQSGGAYAAAETWALLLTVGLVFSVALHEAAHAVAALAVGARVRSVTLVALGGCTVAERVATPGRQALIAVAGPTVSLLAGAILCALGLRAPGLHLDARVALISLAQVQVVLGGIDLIPAPPLDGGRLLVAALEGRVGRARATAIAATVGRAIAATIALASVARGHLLGVTFAGLLWAGAELTTRGAGRDDALAGITVGELAQAAAWIDGGDALSTVAERMRGERRAELVLAERGLVTGVVLLGDVCRVPPDERAATCARRVGHVVPSVEPELAAATALLVMRRRRVSALPIVAQGRLVGMVTAAAIDAACEIGRLGRDAPASEPSEIGGAWE